MNDKDREHLENVLKHIKLVGEDCRTLALRLWEENTWLARKLMANAIIHDQSKIDDDLEWFFLREEMKEIEPVKFDLALKHHRTHNPHHPEYWGNIINMPDLYLAEMVCDVKVRSNEFGENIRDWLKNSCTKKYHFTTSSKTYKKIKRFLDILLDTPFK